MRRLWRLILVRSSGNDDGARVFFFVRARAPDEPLRHRRTIGAATATAAVAAAAVVTTAAFLNGLLLVLKDRRARARVRTYA